MHEIKLIAQQDWAAHVAIMAAAYPGFDMFSAESQQQTVMRTVEMSQDPAIAFYGAYAGNDLVGTMRLFDYQMKLLSTETLVGGVGGVAVALDRKKERVAYDMIQYFLKHYRDRGACLTALYPFRPDFYKKMGFGYGTPLHQYKFSPDSLPRGEKSGLRFLTQADQVAIDACYGRYRARTNGLFSRLAYDYESLFSRASYKIIGYWEEDVLRGYLIFHFQRGSQVSFMRNNLVVDECVYETAVSLHRLLTFLHTQADQFETVILNTQDNHFFRLLPDPRLYDGDMLLATLSHASSTQAVGIMYRVVDVGRLFTVLADHDFNGHSCRLKLVVDDSFFPENSGETVIWFENGRCHLPKTQEFDVTVRLGVADLSSLITGAVNLATLCRYGLVDVDDPTYVDTLDALFAAPPPLCMSRF